MTGTPYPSDVPIARTSIVAVAISASLLVTGCSGDDDSPSDSSNASQSSSGDATGAAGTLLQAGLDQMATGQDKAARTTFENVLSLDPDNLYALYNLGVIAQRAGKSDEALDFYDQALGVQDDYTPALFNKAILLEKTDLDQSIQIYRQVIGIDDTMAAAYMRLGFALVHLGKHKEGAEFLEQGIALDPSMTEIEAPNYE